MSDPIELLARSPLFSGLAPQHREQIAPHLARRELAAGAEIVRQGDPGDAVYLVDSGSVGVFLRDPKLGLVQLVATIEPPEIVGEMALLTGARRTATCTAMEPTVVYRLERDVFLAIVQQAPAVALGLARTLSERLQALTLERRIPWASLAGRALDPRLWALAPEQLLRGGRIAPLELSGKTLKIAMVDPADSGALDALSRAVPGLRFEVVAVGVEDWVKFVDGGGRRAPAVQQAAAAPASRPSITFVDDEAGPRSVSAQGAQVIALVEEVVATGLGLGASDIHIEADRRGVLVRYRVDGVLQERGGAPVAADQAKQIASRLKVLAKLDITESRRPQDGRISLRSGNRTVDLRVSTMPAKLGEKIVMRILDADANVSDLKSIFEVDKVRQVFSQMVFRPHGLVMITGPTGSGKTTTLYSALFARRKPELNMVTVEDPIEYHLDGVTQVEVHPEAGTTFPIVLRALLRQDPDVIAVGEMRDLETAKMAVEASMTGHLVLTSVHTNGALDCVIRLRELGVEPYALSHALVGVLHQRLVRRCCPACTEPFEYPEPIVQMLGKVGAFGSGEKPTLYRGKGCPKCRGTGFKGRVGLFELLIVSDAVRAAIAAGADATALQAAAGSGSLMSLARYAGLLVSRGATVPGEVVHLLQRVDE